MRGLHTTMSRAGRVALAAILLVTRMPASAAAKRPAEGPTPIVLFPAWHFTRLTVTVHNQ